MNDIERLDVAVDSAPVPGLLRARIESALARRGAEHGPEQVVGQAVADAVAAVVLKTGAGSEAGHTC